MARVSSLGVFNLDGSAPPFEPGAQGNFSAKASIVHLDEGNPVNATVVLTVGGEKVDERTVFVEYPGRGVTLSGHITVPSQDFSCCAVVKNQV